MEKNNIKEIFESLLDDLKKSLTYLTNEKDNIVSQLRKWDSEISYDELCESIKLIEKHIQKWYKNYLVNKSTNIIELSDYQIVSKESAYLIGECSLIDGIKIEAIDWQIGIIGDEIVKSIRERNGNNGRVERN